MALKLDLSSSAGVRGKSKCLLPSFTGITLGSQLFSTCEWKPGKSWRPWNTTSRSWHCMIERPHKSSKLDYKAGPCLLSALGPPDRGGFHSHTDLHTPPPLPISGPWCLTGISHIQATSGSGMGEFWMQNNSFTFTSIYPCQMFQVKMLCWNEHLQAPEAKMSGGNFYCLVWGWILLMIKYTPYT